MLRFIRVAGVAALLLASAGVAQNATVYTYDARGRLTYVSDSTGHATGIALDAADNRTGVSTLEQYPYAYAAGSLYHGTGHADGASWAAAVEEAEGHMIYGPYTYHVSQGNHVAAFLISVDNNAANNLAVVRIEVADGFTGGNIVSRTLYRNEWRTSGSFETFELPFALGSQHLNHPIEFRIYYLRTAYVRVSKVGFR